MCGGKMKRVPEVIDCWFDSGAMHTAQWHYPFENKEIFEKIEANKQKAVTSFVVDRLDFLHKGGRCSLLSLIGAKLIKIHPQIAMKDGALAVKAKYQGSMIRSLNRYVEDLAEEYHVYDKTRAFIIHSPSDQEIVDRWESSNLGSYSWVFSNQYAMIPILEDIIRKADAAVDGSGGRVADLRFGHDSCIGPLTVLMGIHGADKDPEDPYEVKECYQNWETCKAANIQLVFYRGRKASDPVLVKCMLNGYEATLPIATDSFPYYKWDDLRRFYIERCGSVK